MDHRWIRQHNEEDLICQHCKAGLKISELEALTRDSRWEQLFSFCEGKPRDEDRHDAVPEVPEAG